MPKAERLPDGLRFHDLRHVYASFPIAAGLGVKVVQKRMRHASTKLTLDTYGHRWPRHDDGTREAVGVAFASRQTPALKVV